MCNCVLFRALSQMSPQELSDIDDCDDISDISDITHTVAILLPPPPITVIFRNKSES